MKRLVVLLFGLVGAALFMSAANSGDRVLRDSIFHVYRSMPADTCLLYTSPSPRDRG